MLRLLFLLLIPVAVMASEPYASTYVPLASDDLLIVNATVLTGTGERLSGVDVHLARGRIEAIGSGLSRDANGTYFESWMPKDNFLHQE